MKKGIKKAFSLLLAIVLCSSSLTMLNSFLIEASAFSPRLTAPGHSGYYEPNSSMNPFSVNAGGNCTWYAWGRAYEILGTRPKLGTGNASTWYSYNQQNGYYPYGSTPRLGAIACWGGGSTGAGHVAVVEQINSDGSFVISESSWSATDWYFRTRTLNANGYYASNYPLQGYIYIYDSVPTTATISINTTRVQKGNTITFSVNSDTATSFNIGINRDGTRVLTQGVFNNSFTYTCSETGIYSAYVTASNNAGYKDSETVEWIVYDHSGLASDFYAYIVKQNSGKYLTMNASAFSSDSNGKAYNVQLADTNNNNDLKQLWHFVKQSDGSYKIYNQYNNSLLDVADGGTGNGANVITYTKDHGGPNQRWYFFVRNNNYVIAPGNTTKILDVTDNKDTAGTNIELWAAHYGTAQIFALKTCVHNWEWVTDRAATCTTAGVKHQLCSNCGATQSANTAIAALGHNWGSWTRVSDTQHQRTCSRCSTKETGNHTWDNGAANAALNTCTVCKATVSRYVTVNVHPAGGTWNGKKEASALQQLPGSTVQLGKASGYDGHDFLCWIIDYSGTGHVLQPWGTPLHVDPSFTGSMSDTAVYNNAGNGNVTVTKVSKSSDAPTTSAYMLQVKTTGTASPGLGGYWQITNSKASGVFYHMIIAKIPVGYKLERASNACGDGYSASWLTSQEGTGNFEVYIYKTVCGTKGTFSTFGHVYLSGTAATASDPVTWYVAYSEVFDGTGVSSSGTNYIVGTGIANLRALWKEGHTWDSGKVTKQPTCGSAGVKTYTCTVCSETKTEPILATGNHTWNDGEITTPASCTVAGVKTYTCTVCGAKRTEPIPMLEQIEPTILSQPTNATVDPGERAYFHVTADGGNLSYQWQYSKDNGKTWKNSTGQGATTADLNVAGNAANAKLLYHCVITNDAGSITTVTVRVVLTVAPPVINTQPVNAEVTEGDRAYFHVAASGTDLTYQWQYSKDNGKTWKNSTAATANTADLNVAGSAANAKLLYHCVITNAAGSATTVTVRVVLTLAPVIVTQPADTVVTGGARAYFSVAATGENLTYQWQYSKDNGKTWKNSTGQGAATADLNVAGSANNAKLLYRCVITNAYGSATTETVKLTLN